MTTRSEAIAEASTRLAAKGVPEPARDARLLYRWAARLSGAELQAGLTDQVKSSELVRFGEAVAMRAERRPVAHITGMREFWKWRFQVSPDVLDPRPETEILVEEALKKPASRILDLGTGSGCILLSILAEMPGATGVGVDISEAALSLARQNAETLGLAARTDFQCGGWNAAVGEGFDLIVSNPPYLDAEDMAALQPELAFEPAIALSSGDDGLDACRAIIATAPHRLARRGRLIMEIGATQAMQVRKLLLDGPYTVIRILQDTDGRDRAVFGRKSID